MDNSLKQKWIEKKFLDRDYPEDKVEELLGLYEAIEKWETKASKKGGPFNLQFCSDIYAIASIMTRDGSFKGKFKPDELYVELVETMKTVRKGKDNYSIYDEAKVVGMVMDNHKKKK